MPVTLSGKSVPLKYCHYHTHSTWEVILNLEGSGVDLIDGAEYPFSPGAILCVPPNTPHAKVSDEPYKDIFIQSTGFVVSERQEVLCFRDDDDKSMELLMNLAHRTFHQKEKNYKNIVESLYDAIQHLLLSKSKSPVKNHIINQLTVLIADNFSDPEFEVSGAIESLPYSKDYVRRLFRKEMGMTPVSYLNGLRLAHAKRLLKQHLISGDSVAEIALMCGFYDPRYFSRLFRRETGQSPLQYSSAQ